MPASHSAAIPPFILPSQQPQPAIGHLTIHPAEPTAPSLSALILAGGNSRRMGQDKALLPWRGRPLIHHISQIAQQVCDGTEPGRSPGQLSTAAPSVWVLTPRVQQYQPLLPPGCQCLGEVLDLPQATASAGAQAQPQGPLLAFAQGLGQLSTDWVLLLACDLPQLCAAELRQAATQLDQLPESQLAWLPPGGQAAGRAAEQPPDSNPPRPRWEPRWEPLCGFYRRRCLASLHRAIAQGERSFQGWLDQIPVAPLRLPTPAQLKNCNSPSDWAEALAD